jgi:hypothetical protein
LKNNCEESADRSKAMNSSWMEERLRRKSYAKEKGSEEIRGYLGKT